LPLHEAVVVAPHTCAIGSQAWPLGQPPHAIVVPQIVRSPHPIPRMGQSDELSGLGQATQVFEAWSQVLPEAQPPQSTTWPQSFATWPHSIPRSLQVDRGVEHRPVVRSQISPDAQVKPHWSVPVHPSDTGPQRPVHAAVAVSGMQAAVAASPAPESPPAASIVTAVASPRLEASVPDASSAVASATEDASLPAAASWVP
jgi:hypothetical protein